MATAACSAVLIAGCGSATTKTAAAPTKAQYIARADAICARELSQKARAFARSEAPGQSGFSDRSKDLTAAEEANASLRALAQPPGSASVLDEWLRLRERYIAIDRGRPARAGERDVGTGKAYSIAKAYGFQSCAEPPGDFLLRRYRERQQGE
jgi:hypothetical protein